MSQSVQTAHALNNLSSNVAQALEVQASVNAQLKGGLMVVNQRIDFVQEHIDTLWQLAQLGCQWKYSSFCITSIQYENFTRAANLSKQMSKYLLGNWTVEFDSLMDQLAPHSHCEHELHPSRRLPLRTVILDHFCYEPSEGVGGNGGSWGSLIAGSLCMPLVLMQIKVYPASPCGHGSPGICSH